jgi:hypothetical protein
MWQQSGEPVCCFWAEVIIVLLLLLLLLHFVEHVVLGTTHSSGPSLAGSHSALQLAPRKVHVDAAAQPST